MAFPKLPFGQAPKPTREMSKAADEEWKKGPPELRSVEESRKIWMNLRYGRLPENGQPPREHVAREAFQEHATALDASQDGYGDQQLEVRVGGVLDVMKERLSEHGQAEWDLIRQDLNRDLDREFKHQTATREVRVLREENRMMRGSLELSKSEPNPDLNVDGFREAAEFNVDRDDRRELDRITDFAHIKLDRVWERETGERLLAPANEWSREDQVRARDFEDRDAGGDDRDE